MDHYLHSLGLKVEDQLDVEYPDDLYIEETMKKRSELRQLCPSHVNLTPEEEWIPVEDVEEQPATAVPGQPHVSSRGKNGGGVDSPQDMGITLSPSDTSHPRPIPMGRETVDRLNTSSPLNTSPIASQASGIGPPLDYFKEASSSIKLIQELASGDQVQLHLRQCRYLSFKMNETGSSLKAMAKSLVGITSGDDVKWKALRQLHFTVKRAEKLLRSCCCKVESSWLQSAVTLSQIKEDIVDILLDLCWWTSMVDIAIASVARVTSGGEIELKLLELAEKNFQKLLRELQLHSEELDEAVAEDKKQLLLLVRKVLSSYSGKPRDREYLLATHVRTRLENTDLDHEDEELKAFDYGGLRGMGSFGVVLNVTWLGRKCALKMLKYRCMKEATTLSAFHHPHIVQFFRYWEAPFYGNPAETASLGTPRLCRTEVSNSPSTRVSSEASLQPDFRKSSQILMELMPTDLAQYMLSVSTNSMSLDVAIDVMVQVAKAMWHLNNSNVAHRDLKPSNVLLRPVSVEDVPELAARGHMHAKLCDFGIVNTEAKSIANSSGTKLVGTMMYGAPEVFIQDSVILKESPKFPRLADVWSFGIMFSEMLSGNPPFLAEQTHSMGEMHTRILKGLRPELPANCPDYLKFCITNCWQLRPQDRPNFADLWKLLRFAQVRSLGLIREDHELFTFATIDGVVKRLQKRPEKDPKPSSLWLHFRRITFPFPRRRDQSTEAIQNSNRKQRRAGSSKCNLRTSRWASW